MALLLPWLDPCISLDSLPDICPIHNTTFKAQIHLSHHFLDLSSHPSPFLFSHHPLCYPFPFLLSFFPPSLLFYPLLHSPPLVQFYFVLSFPFVSSLIPTTPPPCNSLPLLCFSFPLFFPSFSSSFSSHLIPALFPTEPAVRCRWMQHVGYRLYAGICGESTTPPWQFKLVFQPFRLRWETKTAEQEIGNVVHHPPTAFLCGLLLSPSLFICICFSLYLVLLFCLFLSSRLLLLPEFSSSVCVWVRTWLASVKTAGT